VINAITVEVKSSKNQLSGFATTSRCIESAQSHCARVRTLPTRASDTALRLTGELRCSTPVASAGFTSFKLRAQECFLHNQRLRYRAQEFEQI